MDTIERLYQDPGSRARELHAQGKKVVGYFCCFTPVELVTAAGMVPFRISGDPRKPASKADGYVETIMCPFVRSALDAALRGNYDFFDGFVVPHTCDNITKVYDIWRLNLKPSFSHFVNVPHTASGPSMRFFEKEIEQFKMHLETISGQPITAAGLMQAINLHNENRSLVRRLYDLRKPDPPLVSGVEVLKILTAARSLPVTESNQLLREVTEELKSRRGVIEKKAARILLWGSEIDDAAVVAMVEESGANVVADDLCTGSRSYRCDVAPGSDALSGLAKHYLSDLTCPRTYRERTGERAQDLENRFGHLLAQAREYKANGAIFFIIRFCDTFGFDVPDAKEFLEGNGIPCLHVEDEYNMVALGRRKTMVQAFLETLG